MSNSKSVLTIYSGFVFLLCLIGCNGSSADDNMTIDKIYDVINSKLNSESSKSQVEDFIKEMNWEYSYDRHAHRYQATFKRSPSSKVKNSSVGIYIYIDPNGKFEKAVVESSYNSL